MLEPYRDQFNARFTGAQYADLLDRLNRVARSRVEFRVCETPCFFSRALMDLLADTGRELTHQLLNQQGYMRDSEAAVPLQYRVPRENAIPNFMTVDFGLARAADGSLEPKLVEMQAFPSVYGYQDALARRVYRGF